MIIAAKITKRIQGASASGADVAGAGVTLTTVEDVVVVVVVALVDKMTEEFSTADILPNVINCSSFVLLASINLSAMVAFVVFVDDSKIISKSNPTLPSKNLLILMSTQPKKALLQNGIRINLSSMINARDLGDAKLL